MTVDKDSAKISLPVTVSITNPTLQLIPPVEPIPAFQSCHDEATLHSGPAC